MTLEADTGAPLNLTPAVDQSDDGDTVAKPRRIPQRADRWCWAASIESARRTLPNAPGRRQHLIASRQLACGNGLCRNFPGDDRCNQTIDRRELECLWRKEGFGQATYQRLTISFDDIKTEVAAKRLVQLEIANRHVVLAYGWRIDSVGVQLVRLIDTDGAGAPSEWPFGDLDLYDGWGAWEGTCLGLTFDGSTSC